MRYLYCDCDHSSTIPYVYFFSVCLIVLNFCNNEFCFAVISLSSNLFRDWVVCRYCCCFCCCCCRCGCYFFTVCLLGNINCIFIFNCSRCHLSLNSNKKKRYFHSVELIEIIMWKLCAVCCTPVIVGVKFRIPFNRSITEVQKNKTWFHTIGNKIRNENCYHFFLHHLSLIKLMWSLMSHSRIEYRRGACGLVFSIFLCTKLLVLFFSVMWVYVCMCVNCLLRMWQLKARFDLFYWQYLSRERGRETSRKKSGQDHSSRAKAFNWIDVFLQNNRNKQKIGPWCFLRQFMAINLNGKICSSCALRHSISNWNWIKNKKN